MFDLTVAALSFQNQQYSFSRQSMMVNATTKCLTMAKTEQSGAFNYHLLRNALNSFSKNIDQLVFESTIIIF